jgi:Flp pilus assembly pilin Flp
LKLIGKFKEEERGQGGIEYILLAGGIILAAVVIVSIYSSMVGGTATTLNESVGTKVGEMSTAIGNAS